MLVIISTWVSPFFSDLSWRIHIFNVYEKASKKLNLLKGLKFKLGRETLIQL
jgi:hypothetical protein